MTGDIKDLLATAKAKLEALKAKVDDIPDDAPITPDDISFFVNQDLRSLNPEDFEGDSINWGDLRCVDVSISGEEAYIWISEASPECSKLPAHIESRMSADTGLKCIVICEW